MRYYNKEFGFFYCVQGDGSVFSVNITGNPHCIFSFEDSNGQYPIIEKITITKDKVSVIWSGSAEVVFERIE